jgi:tRNA (guanine-N7-)-methyltransferase
MPHLVIKKFKEIDFPKKSDEVEFEFIASNIHYKNEKLISVKVKEGRFFLVVKEDDNKVILKSDKTTRPASTNILHNALNSYARLALLEVLHSNVPSQKQNPHLKEISALKDIEFFAKNFPLDKEVHIEVGFGSGRHLLYQAKQNPNILFIGIEIHRPSIEQVLKQININKLDNILVLDYDARLFMEQVPSNIVGKIYVHFPVPWDKKPHRRVISEKFVSEAMRVLKVEGRLELRTDSENYYAYSYETFMSFGKIHLEIRKNKDIAITSKYEDRWKKMEKNIYDLTMINDIDSPPLEIVGDFNFEEKELDFTKIENLHTKKIVENDFFIHFERVYKIDESGYLIKLSMGSFDRPEHLYLLIRDKKISYYPRLPLKSRANLDAHKKITEVING